MDIQNYEKTQNSHLQGIKRQRWTAKEDLRLRKAISQCGFEWLAIAQLMPNRNPNQCSQRWKKLCGCYSQKKNFWTKEEDEILLQLVKKLGQKWRMIEQNFPGRSCKQCRDRYMNQLDPTLKKESFSELEDQIIYEQYLIHGSKWSVISKELPGRAQNQVKNRFYTYIRTKFLQIKNPYFSKSTSEEAKNELENARQTHLKIIQQTVQNEYDESNNPSEEEYDLQPCFYSYPQLLNAGKYDTEENFEF